MLLTVNYKLQDGKRKCECTMSDIYTWGEKELRFYKQLSYYDDSCDGTKLKAGTISTELKRREWNCVPRMLELRALNITLIIIQNRKKNIYRAQDKVVKTRQ